MTFQYVCENFLKFLKMGVSSGEKASQCQSPRVSPSPLTASTNYRAPAVDQAGVYPPGIWAVSETNRTPCPPVTGSLVKAAENVKKK